MSDQGSSTECCSNCLHSMFCCFSCQSTADDERQPLLDQRGSCISNSVEPHSPISSLSQLQRENPIILPSSQDQEQESSSLPPTKSSRISILQHSTIKRCLECQYDLLDHLQHNGCLTVEIVNELKQNHRTERERNNALLGFINPSNVYKFKQGLEASNQSHLANFINRNGTKESIADDNWPVSDSDIAPILKSYPDLVRDIYNKRLIDELFAKKCLSPEQKNKILSRDTAEERNRELLSITMRRSVRQLKVFLHWLESEHAEILSQSHDMGLFAVELDVIPDRLINISDDIIRGHQQEVSLLHGTDDSTLGLEPRLIEDRLYFVTKTRVDEGMKVESSGNEFLSENDIVGIKKMVNAALGDDSGNVVNVSRVLNEDENLDALDSGVRQRSSICNCTTPLSPAEFFSNSSIHQMEIARSSTPPPDVQFAGTPSSIPSSVLADMEGPISFCPPELEERTVMHKEHNELVEKLKFFLDLCQCLGDLSRSRSSPLAKSMLLGSSCVSSSKQLLQRPLPVFSSEGERCLEQLLLNLRALQLLDAALQAARSSAATGQLQLTASIRELLRQMNEMYRDCLVESRQLSRSERMLNDCLDKLSTDSLCIDRLLYGHAIHMCQTAAMDEVQGNPYECSQHYHIAYLLFHCLAHQAPDDDDRALLIGFREGVQKRLMHLHSRGYVVTRTTTVTT